MRISRASAYAIGAVLQLAEAPPKVPIPCSRLAKTGEMPERFLLQVLRNLVNHGILKSTRGVDGGYSLVRPASEISLLQILEATDGPLSPELPPLECVPQGSRSRLQDTLRGITAEACRRLADMKLVELQAGSAQSSEPGVERQEKYLAEQLPANTEPKGAEKRGTEARGTDACLSEDSACSEDSAK